KEPLQIVHRQVQLPLAQLDWREFSPIEQKDRLEAYLAEDRERGFDLSRPPLMRHALIRLSEQSHIFVWSCHHILLDGWSGALVCKEVQAFYEAFREGQSLQLDRPRSYRDYIVWLRKQDLSAAETFWRSKLKGFTVP